jgi:Arc/MetJ-type ribon-helix-helix transcriptional regulator
MTFEIPADLQSFVSEQLQHGCFTSEQQLVTEALRLLKAEREESLEGIRMGLADTAAGRVQPLADAFADLRREL